MAEIIRFRLLMTAAGHEDGNDATALRFDPVFKMAQDHAPSRPMFAIDHFVLKNLPSKKVLLRMSRAMVGLPLCLVQAGAEANHARHRRYRARQPTTAQRSC